MNIYQIDARILGCIDQETGEIVDQEQLDALMIERDTKIENVALWYKNQKAQAEAIKAEEQALKQRWQYLEMNCERLKRYLAENLAGDKFDSAKVRISYRASEELVVLQGAEVPEEFLKFKDPEIDKMQLKKAVKNGLVLDGVFVKKNQNIQIK